jgi:hypothetical protein
VQGQMLSSTETKKKKLEKLDEISEGRNRKEAGSKNKEESSKNIKKKEDEDLKGRRKKTKVSEYFKYMPNSSIAYLDGETSSKTNISIITDIFENIFTINCSTGVTAPF